MTTQDTLTPAETRELLADFDSSPALSALRSRLVTAATLQGMTFPALLSYIEGLVIEGLTVFGGKPKLGKSWWALLAALTIATGGVAFGNPARPVTAARVLYLALEDGERRLQDRLRRLLAPGEPWPERLSVVTTWPRLDVGGLELLAELVDMDGFGVVIIDTLGRVRSPRSGRGDAYLEDVAALAALHDLARERPGLAVWAVHHARKDTSSGDYVDALSGTTGLSGVADHIAVLQRGRGEADAVLAFTSRDAAEHETAYAFTDGAWSELGAAAAYSMSKARRDLLDALTDAGGTATLTDLSEAVGKAAPTVLKMLRGMEVDGEVRQAGERGSWNLANSAKRLNPPATDLALLVDLAQFPEDAMPPCHECGGEGTGFTGTGSPICESHRAEVVTP